MGGSSRKGCRRSSLTRSSPGHKRLKDTLDRHGNKRKSIVSPRRRGDGDDFAYRHTNYTSQQSRHPHHLSHSKSRSRSVSISSKDIHDCRRCACREYQSRRSRHSRSRSRSRNSPKFHDSRRCTSRESEYRRHIKKEPRDSSCDTAKISKKKTHRKRSSSSDSQHHKIHPHEYRRHIKKEPRDSSCDTAKTSKKKTYRKRSSSSDSQNHKKYVNQISKKRKTYRKRSSSSDSQHHKKHVNVDKKRKKEETNMDSCCIEGKLSNKSSSVKEFSNHFLEKCNKYITQGNLKKAISCINVALKACKNDDKFSSKLYSRRGIVQSLIDKPRCSLQSFIDWERALQIDEDNIEARVNMSKVFFKAANELFKKKSYEKALSLCNHALALYKRNGEASVLVKILKKKILETKSRRESTSVEEIPCPTSTSMKRKPERLSVNKVQINSAVLDEVKRLNALIADALKTNNYAQALKYCNLALRLFKQDNPDDNLYNDLLVLKKQLMNFIA